MNADIQVIQDASGRIQSLLDKLSAHTAPALLSSYSQLQSRTPWVQPGNTGDTGGGSAKPNGKFTVSPGTVAVFSAAGAYPYNNGYWYFDIPQAPDHAVMFRLDLEVNVPDTSLSQAIEFELEQCIHGVVYNMGWQHPFQSSGVSKWRVFNYASKQWELTSIPVSIQSGKWAVISAEYVRIDNKLMHTYLIVDGVRYAVGVSHAGVPTYPTTVSYVHAAIQLDSKGQTVPAPYSVGVSNLNVYLG